jgi:hypothetical protein
LCGNDFSIVFATPEMAAVVNAASPRASRLHDGSSRDHSMGSGIYSP